MLNADILFWQINEDFFFVKMYCRQDACFLGHSYK